MGVLLYDVNPENYDIDQLIELLMRLINVAKAKVVLPPSLRGPQALRDWAEEYEDLMMGAPDPGSTTVKRTLQ